MRIGVHPNNLHLRLASLWPGSFADFDPEFVPYGEGRDTASLLEGGHIHFGGTGSTPPIEADARGLGVCYIAASAPRPANGAIFARSDSDIGSVADLVGKRISLVDGSFHTYLLARSLEGEGFGLPDVTRVESGDLDSLKELLEGRVDAWVAMSPRLEKVIERKDLRLIVRCGSTIPNRSLFWTLQRHALSAETIRALVLELDRIGREVMGDTRKAAELLAAEAGSEGDAAAWDRVLRSRDFSVVPADDPIIAEQQAEADTLYRHGHFSNPVALQRQAKLA
ncbi:ABC transporter substrate-binding protein [Rhizobium straminoryzae]|uniref:PhnD/SsuA/transferrin family substrate-binding protein n=1 Tax=Rhizobium straminoryzae TaxID=1387186 RepID=A0A549SV43_9HYPH|nr:ABC transporter substrate-binding protein [Rhizobium straminoryzae]TRL33506.1 PhnD/SsuA/transferrin family substrate-binding protein [Rhizobium straminoryzae]